MDTNFVRTKHEQAFKSGWSKTGTHDWITTITWTDSAGGSWKEEECKWCGVKERRRT